MLRTTPSAYPVVGDGNRDARGACRDRRRSHRLRFDRGGRGTTCTMYIGGGVIVLILIILLVLFLVRR
jgi:hypothetical protein